MLTEADDESGAKSETNLVRRYGANGDSPTLGDVILSHEHDPPI